MYSTVSCVHVDRAKYASLNVNELSRYFENDKRQLQSLDKREGYTIYIWPQACGTPNMTPVIYSEPPNGGCDLLDNFLAISFEGPSDEATIVPQSWAIYAPGSCNTELDTLTLAPTDPSNPAYTNCYDVIDTQGGTGEAGAIKLFA